MKINKIRAKQTVLEAVQLTEENIEELRQWLAESGYPSHFYPAPDGVVLVFKNALGGNSAIVSTDWLVKFTDGTFAKVDDEQFHENYDILEDGQ